MKTVLVTGYFEVLHPGHVRLLRFAKQCGEKLIVGVNREKNSEPLHQVDAQVRLDTVSAISFVDEVVMVDPNVPELIRLIKPDVVVKGKEFESQINEEEEILSQYGGQLVFSSGQMDFSYQYPLQMQSTISQHRLVSLRRFMERHQIKSSNLSEIVKQFTSKKVCVLGDLIVDEYINCFPVGMSQEEPTLVVTPNERTNFIGGAGIVACHASSLGADVDFYSVAGEDLTHEFAKKKLLESNVNATIWIEKNRQTSLKQRFRCSGRSLLRVNHLSQQSVSIKMQADIIEKVSENLKNYDVLIFSDFNYGYLPTVMVETIIKRARANNIVIAADSQSSSQTGNILRFQGVDLITPTEREARLALHNSEDGLVVLADKILTKSGCENIILKLGSDGLLSQNLTSLENSLKTERIEAINSNPIDPAGAGDSLLIVSALSLACGADLPTSSLLGALASSIQVARVGNIPLKQSELLESLII